MAALTLTDMRARVRKYVDDVAQKRYDSDGANTDVDGALANGVTEAFALVAAMGGARFRQTSTLTASTAGLIDLSAIKPVRIYAVRLATGAAPFQTFAEVRPARQDSYRVAHNAAESVSITCIPGAVFPASAGATVTWGVAGIEVPELDDLACLLAASNLKVIEGEENPVLQRRKAEARAAVQRMPDITSWSVSDGYKPQFWGPCLYYVALNPNALQLVER